MIEKKQANILIILFILIVLSLMIPLNNPTGYAVFGPNLGDAIGEFKITKYYTVSEKDFEIWRDGRSLEEAQNYYMDLKGIRNDPIAIEKMKKLGWCIFGTGNLKRGFFEDVKCQGSGISKNGKLCRYNLLKEGDTNDGNCLEPNSEFSNGKTATGTNPTPHRTIAVDFSKGYKDKNFYIFFGDEHTEWNGCYKGEDTGSAIKGNHFDLYVGVGKEELDYAILPEKALVYEDCEMDEDYKEVINEKSKKVIKAVKKFKSIGGFKFNPSFEVSEDYDFTIYERIVDVLKTLSADCGSVDNKRECVEGFLASDKNSAKLKLGPQDRFNAELINFVEQVDLCSKALESNTNCLCNISIDKKGDLNQLYENLKINSYPTSNNIIFKYNDWEYKIPYYDRFEAAFIIKYIEGVAEGKEFPPITKDIEEDRSYFYIGSEKNDKDELKFFISKEQKDNLPICNIDQKKYVFSIKNDKRFMYFDDEESKYEIGSPDIEFAFYLKEDLTEPEEVWAELENIDFSQDKVMLKFDESKEKDVMEYYIFHSEYPFDLGDLDEVLSDEYQGLIKKEQVFKDNDLEIYNDYESIPSKCEEMTKIPDSNCNLFFKLNGEDGVEEKILEFGKTYYFKNKGEYIKIFDFSDEDFEKVYFKVIAIDASGNKLNFDEVDTEETELKDLLHPSAYFEIAPEAVWDGNDVRFDFTDAVVKNIDGSEATDIKEYWLYQKKDIESQAILDNIRYYPIKITKSQIEASSNIYSKAYAGNPSTEKYCYVLLATDMELPSQSDYSEVLSEDPYYGNLVLDHICIP